MTATAVHQETITVEPEYEWGVQYQTPEGFTDTSWGYQEDPRITGVVDEDNEIQVGGSWGFCEVLAVGRRQKSPEIWETI
jgi:hypothetical protein